MLRTIGIAVVVLTVGAGSAAAVKRFGHDPSRLQSIPAGAQLDLLLTREIDAGVVKIDEKFEATLVTPVAMGGSTLLPDGSIVSGYIGSVRVAGRDQESRMALAFSTIRVNDRDLRMRGTVAAVLSSRKPEDPRSAAGPISGVPTGPAAVSNVVVSTGGSILAKDGRNVRLPVGVILRVRLDEPIVLSLSVK